jgi:hypothetical protein
MAFGLFQVTTLYSPCRHSSNTQDGPMPDQKRHWLACVRPAALIVAFAARFERFRILGPRLKIRPDIRY